MIPLKTGITLSNNLLNCERLDVIFEIWNKSRKFVFNIFMQVCAGSPSQWIKARKINITRYIGKEEINKHILLMDNMIICTENHKSPIEKLLN